MPPLVSQSAPLPLETYHRVSTSSPPLPLRSVLPFELPFLKAKRSLLERAGHSFTRSLPAFPYRERLSPIALNRRLVCATGNKKGLAVVWLKPRSDLFGQCASALHYTFFLSSSGASLPPGQAKIYSGPPFARTLPSLLCPSSLLARTKAWAIMRQTSRYPGANAWRGPTTAPASTWIELDITRLR